MRTTLELTDPQRAELLRLAAARGLKGFSTLVQEAVDLYLAEQRRQADLARAALALEGTLRAEDADELRRATTALREAVR